MAYHMRLLSPVQKIPRHLYQSPTGGVALGRVFEILDVPVEVKESPRAIATIRARRNYLDRVALPVFGRCPVIDVSRFRSAGALVHRRSQAARASSTLADLLLRFYDHVGRIRLTVTTCAKPLRIFETTSPWSNRSLIFSARV